MEQVKYVFHGVKSFILHNKSLSIVIGCIIILDSSLLGVISDIQQRQFLPVPSPTITVRNSHIVTPTTLPTLSPEQRLPSSSPIPKHQILLITPTTR